MLRRFSRKPLAAFIARVRQRSAIANYMVMGGASTLLAETKAQAAALTVALSARLADAEVQVFIAMRYWRPSTTEAATAVTAFGPDEVVLAPLYPQYSTTTTGSSFAAWREVYGGDSHAICCWYDNEGLIAAQRQPNPTGLGNGRQAKSAVAVFGSWLAKEHCRSGRSLSVAG